MCTQTQENQEISWCKGLNKDNNKKIKEISEKILEGFKTGRIIKKFGKDNPNFGNKWDQEKRKNWSDFQKEKSNFSLNNPQKINPNRGMDCGSSQYKYLIYDSNILILETFSLTEASEKLKLNYNMLRKISVNGNKYLKRYTIQRIKYKGD